MTENLIDIAHRIKGEDKRTISARKSAEVWELSKGVILTAIESEVLKPQSIIQDEPDAKPAYGFHIDYVKEVLRILPKKRGKTQKVFTATVKAKIEEINRRWEKKYPPDDSSRFLITV
jgi:hypothetical protein